MNPMPNWPSLTIATIDGFLNEVEQLFDKITDAWSPLLFKIEFRGRIATAWDEIKKNAHTTLSTIKNAFSMATNEAKEMAGLIGEQLQLKFADLNNAWKIYHENGTVGFLRNLLVRINAILASIASVAGGAEAWKEFKDLIERLIEPTAK